MSSSPSPPPSSSSSSSSTSETPPLSSSSPLPPLLSLRSPELQAEFLQECRNRFRFQSDVGEPGETQTPSPISPSSPLPSPFSSTPTSSPSSASSSASSSPRPSSRPAAMTLSSPELLTELQDSRSRALRRVPKNHGMTTVFSGRGRGRGQVSGSASSTGRTNQKTSP